MSKNNKLVPELRFEEFTENWIKDDFLNIYSKISSKRYSIKKPQIKSEGLYKVVSQSMKEYDGFSNNSEKLFQEPPVIIFGDVTTHIKYVDFNFVVGGDGVVILKPKSGDMYFNFINLSINNLKVQTYRRHFSLLKDISLFHPSEKEQERIGKFLSNIDKRIKLLEEIKDLKKQYKKGLLQALFVGGGS